MGKEIFTNLLVEVAGWWSTGRRKGRSCRRRTWGCLALIFLLLLLSCGLLFWGITSARAAQPDTPAPLSIQLLIDNSNSMFEKGGIGSDPELLRLDAARLFISYLGVDDARVTHSCSVIYFGREAEIVIPFTLLNSDQQRQQIFQTLQDPPRMAWTDPAQALELALANMTSANGRPALIMLTDGKPEWQDDPSADSHEAYLARLQTVSQILAEDQVPLFIVLLANQATDADPEIETIWTPIWQEMASQTAPGRFYVARQATDLMDIYHDIVVALTGSQTAGPIVQADVGAAGLRQTVSVEPDLNRLTFVISKSDPALTVSILQPDGTPLTATMPDVRRAGSGHEEVWVIDSPAAGDWTILISGAGRVMVWKDYRPALATPTPTPLPTMTPRPTMTPTPTATPLPGLQVGPLPNAVLAGQPITVTASLSYIPSGPLTIQLEDDDSVVTEPLLDDGRLADDKAHDGIFSGYLILPEAGTHLVTIAARQGERLLAEWQSRLVVEAAPDLVLTSLEQPRRLRQGGMIQFLVEWQLAGQRVQPDSQLIFTGVEAQLLLPDSSVMPIELEPAGYGAYIGETAVPIAGDIALLVSGETKTASGETSRQQLNQQLTVLPPLPVGRWIGTGLLVVALAGGGAYRAWQRRQPIVTGSLSWVAGTGFSGDRPSKVELDDWRRRTIRVGREGDINIEGVDASFTIRVGLPLLDGHEMLISGDTAVQLNDRPLQHEQPLQDGDLITLNETMLRYQNLRLRNSRRQAVMMADWPKSSARF